MDWDAGALTAAQPGLPPSPASSTHRPAAPLSPPTCPAETRRSAEGVQVNLQPRYPLFGGWATKFLFGWSQPLPSTVSQVRTGPWGWAGRGVAGVGGSSSLQR